MRRLLRALWPRRLAAQLIALLLSALVVSQAVSLVILLDERRVALRAAERAQVLARTASIVRLMEATPPALHPQILGTASSPRLRFSVDDDHAVDATVEAHRDNPLQQRLADLLGGSARQVLVELSDQTAADVGLVRAGAAVPTQHDSRRGPRTALAFARRRPANGGTGATTRGATSSLIASVQLADGRWLNVETRFPPRSRPPPRCRP